MALTISRNFGTFPNFKSGKLDLKEKNQFKYGRPDLNPHCLLITIANSEICYQKQTEHWLNLMVSQQYFPIKELYLTHLDILLN